MNGLTEPVSYTHLDVYKRQVFGILHAEIDTRPVRFKHIPEIIGLPQVHIIIFPGIVIEVIRLPVGFTYVSGIGIV